VAASLAMSGSHSALPDAGRAAGSCTENPLSESPVSAVGLSAPRFPCGAKPAAAGPGANCRSVEVAARIFAVFRAAACGTEDHSEDPVSVGLTVVHGADSAIARSDVLVKAAGTTALELHSEAEAAVVDGFEDAAAPVVTAVVPDDWGAAAPVGTAVAPGD
jgi:hypothetical protein